MSNDGQRVYVGNQEIAAGNPFFPAAPPRISVIDKSTRGIIQTINLPAGKRPGKPVVSLDDRLLYVPNEGTFVSPVGFQGASLNVTGAAINRLAMTPDGALIYAVQTQASPMRLFVIDTLSREVVATVVSSVSPTDLLMNHTGTRVYVLTANSVLLFDTATNTEIRRQLIRQNGRLNSMGLSADGRSLFVNDELATSMLRLNSTTLEIVEQTRRPLGRRIRRRSLWFREQLNYSVRSTQILSITARTSADGAT